MPKIDIEQLDDTQKAQLVENRWNSSSEIWETIQKVYKQNTAVYENRGAWLDNISYKRKLWQVQANRIFVNMEAVINSLIANPAGINFHPARKGVEAQEFAANLESYFKKKFLDFNFKEIMRMGLRNLYFGRLLVFKPYWNAETNDFCFTSLDPRTVRFGKYAKNEPASEFAIEEIEDNLCAVIDRFPEKKDELMKKYGMKNDDDLYIKNPDVKYKEAWIGDYVIFKLDNIILKTIKNPYWDWDGILITDEEEQKLGQAAGEERRNILAPIKQEQNQRQAPQEFLDQGVQQQDNKYKAYYFNYFDTPRKPYIFATVFNNENTPVGRTDMIALSIDLQRGIDKRKMDIDENCEMVNGMLKVDAGVMGKSDAQRIRFETKGIIWGKGVKDGVTREVGQGLPQMVFDDMVDSRNEIDNIMAATSAFRGEREGQETKAGRLALIQQSYMRLNELVQVVDFVYKESFDWAMQLAKTRYTEPHYAKWMGHEDAQKIIEVMQDDFETGSEITVTPGKSLPTDQEFKFEQAQVDVQAGLISPVDYVRIAQYDDPKEIAKNAVLYKQNPVEAVGLPPEKVPLPAQAGEFQPDQMEAILQGQQTNGNSTLTNAGRQL
jgi:hypothetical protein